MLPTLSCLSESGKSNYQLKTSLTRTVIELFSASRFFVKHGGSISATARQQTYCTSNIE